MPAAEISRFFLDPASKLRDLVMSFQFVDGIELALEFLFGNHFVDLRVTRPADPDDLLHRCPVEFAFVPLVAMSRPRNQMVPG